MITAALAGYNVVCSAVPGAGKTTALLGIWQAWERAHPTVGRTMLICYSENLRRETQARVKRLAPEHCKLDVHTFHSLASELVDSTVVDDGAMLDALHHLISQPAEQQTASWPLIMVDELQDARAPYVLLLLILLRARPQTALVLVGDPNQLIMDFHTAYAASALYLTEAPTVFSVCTRPWAVVRLEISHRITPHMLHVVNTLSATHDCTKTIPTCDPHPGAGPVELHFMDMNNTRRLLALVKTALHRGAHHNPEGLLILSMSLRGKRNPVRLLCNHLATSYPLYIHGGDSVARDDVRATAGGEHVDHDLARGAIRVMSCHSSKGLTADAVILLLDNYPWESGRTTEALPNVIYVALTRARRTLFVVMPERSPVPVPMRPALTCAPESIVYASGSPYTGAANIQRTPAAWGLPEFSAVETLCRFIDMCTSRELMLHTCEVAGARAWPIEMGRGLGAPPSMPEASLASHDGGHVAILDLVYRATIWSLRLAFQARRDVQEDIRRLADRYHELLQCRTPSVALNAIRDAMRAAENYFDIPHGVQVPPLWLLGTIALAEDAVFGTLARVARLGRGCRTFLQRAGSMDELCGYAHQHIRHFSPPGVPDGARRRVAFECPLRRTLYVQLAEEAEPSMVQVYGTVDALTEFENGCTVIHLLTCGDERPRTDVCLKAAIYLSLLAKPGAVASIFDIVHGVCHIVRAIDDVSLRGLPGEILMLRRRGAASASTVDVLMMEMSRLEGELKARPPPIKATRGTKERSSRSEYLRQERPQKIRAPRLNMTLNDPV